MYADVPFVDVVYSLATENPGALVLHNYPRHLQNLRRQDSGEPADLAAVELLRDRERGVPRYCEFRRLLDMKVPETFIELTGGRQDLAREIEAIYGDLAKVDLMIGMLAGPYPEGFAFSDTEFRIFILMASRRLKSDRFFRQDYRPEVYTQVGLDWIANNSMKTVVLRHFPQLAAKLAGLGRLDLACRAVQETQPDRLFQAADPSGLADGAKHLSATSMAAIDNAAVSALRCFQTRDTQG